MVTSSRGFTRNRMSHRTVDRRTRDLANEILKAKEDRIDQIETEIEQFEAMGREVYLSTRV